MTKKEVVKEEVVETKEVKEEKKQEVVEDDEFFDKKTKKDIKEKSAFSRVMNVVLWVVLFAWMAVCLIDFYNVHKSKEPMFCISNKTTTYDDGTVDTCTGIGYKVITYKRDSFKAIEFGPFWSKDRSNEKNK